MAIEIVGALAVAALVLWLVFEPLFFSPRPGLAIPEPDAPEETRRGTALLALKEIEFDRETGKLSDRDYDMLKERYSVEALSALAAEAAVPLPASLPDVPVLAICPRCGPRPERDAMFCSWCGRPIA